MIGKKEEHFLSNLILMEIIIYLYQSLNQVLGMFYKVMNYLKPNQLFCKHTKQLEQKEKTKEKIQLIMFNLMNLDIFYFH